MEVLDGECKGEVIPAFEETGVIVHSPISERRYIKNKAQL
jgi:hypothetical protein